MNKMKTWLAVVALLLCGGAWAAVDLSGADVYWDHDFGVTSKVGRSTGYTYTFNINGNTLQADGTFKITSTMGGLIDVSDGSAATWTVLIKYRNLKAISDHRSVLLTMRNGSVLDMGMASSENGSKSLIAFYNGDGRNWAWNANAPTGLNMTAPEDGYAQYAYNNNANHWAGVAETIPSSNGANSASGFSFANQTGAKGFAIGGPRANPETSGCHYGAWDDLEIEAVAIWKGNYVAFNASGNGNTILPSAATDVYAKVDGTAVNFADLAWKASFEDDAATAEGPTSSAKNANIKASADTPITFAAAATMNEMRVSGGHKLTFTTTNIPTVSKVVVDEDSTIKLVTAKGNGTQGWTAPITGGGTLEINPTGGWFLFNGYGYDIGELKVDITTRAHYLYVGTDGRPVFAANHRPRLTMSASVNHDESALILAENTRTYPLYVKNLTGDNKIRVRSDMGNSANNWVRWLDTLQTEETTFAGKFMNCSGRQPGLKVRGNIENKHKALTISNSDNASPANLDIIDYGKVIMTGKWAGSVTVDGTSILELNTSSMIASANLSAGATLKLGKTTSMIEGNLTLADGVVLMLPEGTAEGDAVTLCGGTLTHPTSGVAKIYVGNTAYAATLTYNTTDKTVSYANARAAGTIYMKDGSGTFSTTSGGVADTVLIDGDEVIVPSGVGSRWNVVFTNLGGHTVKVQETSSDPGISIKTAIPENTSIEIAEGSKVYFQGAQTINDGVIFSGAGTLDVGVVVTISGNVTIDSKAVVNSNGFKLAEGGSLKVKLADGINVGTVTSAVSGRNVFCSVADGYATYILSDEAPLATINGVGFASLSDAIDVAAANATITLCKDTTLEIGAAISKALTISAAAAKTLTLVPGGDKKKYVSAADIKNLTLGANVKLDYGWTAHKVISVNYVWQSNNTILAKMAEGEHTEDVDGTLGGLVKRSTWNDIVVAQNGNYVTDSAELTKMAVDGTTLTTISGVTAKRYSRGTYRTKSGNNPLTTDMPFMNGYLDDLDTGDAVSITIDGIPFKTYDVIVYFQTDGPQHPTLKIVQGEVTKNYRYNSDMELKEVNDTGTWGIGNYNGFSYAANVMRVTDLTGSSVKVTTNKASGERSSIAAIQIVQMSTDEEDNAVAQIGEKYYGTLAAALGEVTSGQTIKLLKNVSLASNTTLPTGTNLEILKDVELDTNGFTFTGELNGSGKIIYHGGTNYAFPANPTLGNNWTGICSFTDFCNATDYTADSCNVQFHPDNFANENSKIEFNGVKCYMDQSAGYKTAELIVTDKGSIPGWVIYNGWSHYVTKFKKLSGTGTIFSKWDGDQRYVFASGSDFKGNITIGRDGNLRGPKIIVGTGVIPGQSQTSPHVFILSGAEMTMPASKDWTAKGGIKVDGTLNFAAETSGTARFFSSPLSGSGTINLATPGSNQTRIVFTNAAQDFVGSIAAKQHANFVFAGAGKSSTGMAFSNSGYVCVETGSATLAAGKTWSGTGSTGYGVFVENANNSPATLNLEGDASITGKLFVRSGANLNFLNYGTTAISGNIEPASATINVTIPEATPTGDFPKTLLTWSGTLSSGVNFNLTNSRGYLLQVEDHALKLIAPVEHVWAGTTGDIGAIGNWDDGTGESMFSGESHSVRFPSDAAVKTIDVSSGATLGTITIEGEYTFTGSGTVTIHNLQIGDGASLRLGSGVKINFTQALNKESLAKITFAGGTVSAKSVPHFTQAENLTVDPTAYTTQGGHELISWTDFMTNGEFGYGLPKLNTKALNPAATITNHATDTLGELDWGNGSKARLLGMYGQIFLEVRTAEQLARKPIRILPLGDSITEGYNGSGNCANYRTQLAAKLSMAGYMVETLGYHYVRSRMPSGEWAPLEWQKHAGVSAQRVWTQTVGGSSNARAGDVEAIGPTLNMCGGTPDVVLVKLGTNDMGQGTPDTADRIYEGVFKILNTIHTRFPEAQVIVTTTVQYKLGNDIRQAFNTKLRTYFAGTHESWLHLVDQCKNVGNGSAEGSYNDSEGRRLFYSDNVHPDWAGHNLMAKGWYDKIVELFDVDDGKDKPAKPAYTLGAEANVPSQYLDGFKKVRTLSIAEEASIPQSAFDSYNWKKAVEPTSIEKVGYYLELVRKDTGVHKYIWVDMDKFGDTVDAMGLPTTENHQQVVTKLHVASNMEGVHEIAANVDTETGYIEFSPFDATSTAKSGTGIPTQAWTCMDWNDTLGTSGNGRGCMQVHRVFPSNAKPDGNAGEVLFAYNNWGNANTGVAGTKAGEIGIGNFAQHYMSDTTADGNGVEINTLYGDNSISIYNNSHISIDYTATRFSPVGDMVNAKAYEVRNLEIWVKGTFVENYVSPETELTYESESEATAAVESGDIAINIEDADAKTAGQTTALLKKVATNNGNGTWTVKAELNAAATVPNSEKTVQAAVEETAVSFAQTGLEAVAGATETTNVDIPAAKVVPGLYYSVSFGTTPDNHTQESERVLATGTDGVTIPVPVLGSEKVYYIKIKASATK